MGTTAYEGKGSEGRAANGDRPIGVAHYGQEQHTKATYQTSRATDLLPLRHMLWK